MVRRDAISGNKKINGLLFVQLPLIDHGYNYIQGNVPYAPAAMAAYIRMRHPGKAAVDHLPFVIANLCSDRVVADYIVGTKPDLLCFSCYLWNIERHMAIAEALRGRVPGMKVLMGGPEIQGDSWALSERRPAVDLFVAGEGEWFFDRLFSGVDMERYARNERGNRLIVQPDVEAVDMGMAPEPFTAGELDTMADGSVFMEMTRGCPYRCSYCFYSGKCRGVRERGFNILLAALEKRNRISLHEIYILSPTFNGTPDFHSRLRALAAKNSGVRLHTEMRTEGIDETTAGMLAEAGFRSLEVGIQTLTPEALRRVGRKGGVEKAIDGMRTLAGAGIELKIGVIPGLPGDSPESFMKGVRRLADEGFEQYIELYPLMMLPGTRIRSEGTRDGAVFQRKPPYYLIDGWGFDFDAMTAVRRDLEEITGYTHRTMRLPDFALGSKGAFCAGVRLNGGGPGAWDGVRYAPLIDSAVFSFHIYGPPPDDIGEALRSLFSKLPLSHQLYNVVFHCDHPLDEHAVKEFLESIDGDYTQRRMHLFDEWRDGSRVMVYQVFSGSERYAEAIEGCAVIEPVLRLDRGCSINPATAARIQSGAILVGKGALDSIFDSLLEEWGDRMEDIAFESEEEAALYYRRAGGEYVRWPFGFRVEDLR